MSEFPLTLSQNQLTQICHSRTWCDCMQQQAPFTNFAHLQQASEYAFQQLKPHDWQEAFKGHPMIGNLASLKAQYSQGKQLSANEQEKVKDAKPETLQKLDTLNQSYLDKFGHIFIVFASGKCAEQILNLLEKRITLTPEQELDNAINEQIQISIKRMEVYA